MAMRTLKSRHHRCRQHIELPLQLQIAQPLIEQIKLDTQLPPLGLDRQLLLQADDALLVAAYFVSRVPDGSWRTLRESRHGGHKGQEN
ncbi:hypothetical protein [Devosia aurantiaca]|uniref:Uncharacterized protein n=1 Tax=Devosia aurantiaca TaxID=2714858 RepID=A0A6M1SDS2_9HYPH|nr:hypothetical protein [Devosia aurantiaca]NGP18009.1 hypothetical protein [Devosia aurantiaca]